jgi:hypothetical protein
VLWDLSGCLGALERLRDGATTGTGPSGRVGDKSLGADLEGKCYLTTLDGPCSEGGDGSWSPVRPPLSQRWNAVEREEAARRSRPRGMIFLMAPTLSVGDADRSVSVSIAGTREKLAGFHHFSSLSRVCGEKLWWQARTAPSQKPLNSRAQSPTCCSLPLRRSNRPASRTTRYCTLVVRPPCLLRMGCHSFGATRAQEDSAQNILYRSRCRSYAMCNVIDMHNPDVRDSMYDMQIQRRAPQAQ